VSSPRKRGPIVGPMDSRSRGNDVTFKIAEGDEESRSAEKISQSEIPRRARNDKATGFSAACSGYHLPTLRAGQTLKVGAIS